jgi:hybrid cluster-associated redox disulfide protein
MAKKAIFTNDMTFSEALKKNKDTAKVLKTFGLKCTACAGREAESLRMGAINHGIDPAELLKELNKLGTVAK